MVRLRGLKIFLQHSFLMQANSGSSSAEEMYSYSTESLTLVSSDTRGEPGRAELWGQNGSAT